MNDPESSSMNHSDAVRFKTTGGSMKLEESLNSECCETDSNGSKKSRCKILTACSKLNRPDYYSSMEKGENSNDKSRDVESGNEEKKESNNDAIVVVPKLTSVPLTKDKARDQVREILAEALCQVSIEVDDDDVKLKKKTSACDPYRIAALLEEILFEKWGRFDGLQVSKYRGLMFNLRDPGNIDFRRKILLGKLRTYSIVTMTQEDMASDKTKKWAKKIKKKAVINLPRFVGDWSTVGTAYRSCRHHESIRCGLKIGEHGWKGPGGCRGLKIGERGWQGPGGRRKCIVCGLNWSERWKNQPKRHWRSVFKRYKRSRLRNMLSIKRTS